MQLTPYTMRQCRRRSPAFVAIFHRDNIENCAKHTCGRNKYAMPLRNTDMCA